MVSWSELVVAQNARNITPVHTKRSEGSRCHIRLRNEGVYIHMELRWGGLKLKLSNDTSNHAHSHNTRNTPEVESCANRQMTTIYIFVISASCGAYFLHSTPVSEHSDCVFIRMPYVCDSILGEALQPKTNASLRTCVCV